MNETQCREIISSIKDLVTEKIYNDYSEWRLRATADPAPTSGWSYKLRCVGC